jgi:hypothetical protein
VYTNGEGVEEEEDLKDNSSEGKLGSSEATDSPEDVTRR